MGIVMARLVAQFAQLGGKLLALAGHCRWRLPRGTRGKKLAIAVKVTYRGGASTFTETYPVG